MNNLPRYFNEIPVCHNGMGQLDAYLNGYKHGYQGKVTRGINILTAGTEEWVAWEKGYDDGERQVDHREMFGIRPLS